jgi:hypothetical protein
MAAALNALFDKKKLALTGARFRAWWDGAEFNEEAALAEIEAKLAAANDRTEGADDALFDAPPFEPPSRLLALTLLWGEDRIRPTIENEFELERMQLAPDGVLAVLGPGSVGPLLAIAEKHPGKIEVFEWRDETLEALKHGVARTKLEARVHVARFDLEAHVFSPASYDGLISTDDFAYCSYPPHLAQQIMKCLKPGACAVADAYVGLPSPMFATAFASSFAEPHIRAHGDLLQFFADAGLALEADDDLTEAFLAAARTAFKQLGERLSAAGELDVFAARELAWEAEAWRVRMKLLLQRRLERRRFVLRKPTQPG